MGTGQILLVIVGVAALMILFKLLFVGSPQQSRDGSRGGSATERVGAVAKQATVFADAAMRLVNRAAFKLDDPRINAALFMAGAVGYLADRAGLGDADRSAITGVVLERAGLMTNGEAYGFVGDLLTLSASSPEAQWVDKGRETAHAWLSKKDDSAPTKLADYVHEWAMAGVANI
jgi:hypothetical protein